MSQLNLNINTAFEKKLLKFMSLRKIRNKSAAIRIAVEESLMRSMKAAKNIDFNSWLGAGNKAPENRQPQFKSEDALWE